jgi:hypothetical protein
MKQSASESRAFKSIVHDIPGLAQAAPYVPPQLADANSRLNRNTNVSGSVNSGALPATVPGHQTRTRAGASIDGEAVEFGERIRRPDRPCGTLVKIPNIFVN